MDSRHCPEFYVMPVVDMWAGYDTRPLEWYHKLILWLWPKIEKVWNKITMGGLN